MSTLGGDLHTNRYFFGRRLAPVLANESQPESDAWLLTFRAVLFMAIISPWARTTRKMFGRDDMNSRRWCYRR